MNVSEFLFPNDLEVTPTPIRRVLLIGSCLVDAYRAYFSSIIPHVTFDRITFNNASDLPTHPPADISIYDLQYVHLPLRSVLTDGIIIADNLQDQSFINNLMDSSKRNLNAMLEASLAYNVQYGLLTFVSNFIVPQARISPSLFSGHSALDLTCLIQELNRYLALKIKAYNNVVLADVEMIAASLGKKYFLDDIIYFYSHNTVISHDWAEQEREPDWAAPDRGRIEEISSLGVLYENRHEEFYRAVYRQIESGYRVVNQIDTVKVVIFDLDNTLWRGQVAQHYEPGRIWPNSHGWPVGMWEAVQQLRWRGILTSIVSKNDHDIVVSRWDDVVDLPFLKLSDFINPRINWKHKAENISDLLREINITAKSALFVDDNPVERDSVKAALPGIRAIGANPFETRRILLWSPETQIAALTNESATRASMVKRQIERDKEMSAMTREEFLTTLQCSISFTELFSVMQKDLTRSLELTNKTNQFNTIGRRWKVSEINNYLSEGGRIFCFKVRDRFVDYGLVGVVFTKDRNITQYVMSCRVLGMDIEVAALTSIITNMREHGSDSGSIYGHLIETESNTPCRDVFLKTGFTLVADGEAYELPGDALPTRVGHVRVTWSSVEADRQASASDRSPKGTEDALVSGWGESPKGRRYPPVGEVFHGASFFDGHAVSKNASCGGWIIPAGSEGRDTYHRYIFPLRDTTALAGQTARFFVLLVTSPNLTSKVDFRTDFTTAHSNVGVAGTTTNVALVHVEPEKLIFSWDYSFSGDENVVVGALQVLSARRQDLAVSAVLRLQGWSLHERSDQEHLAIPDPLDITLPHAKPRTFRSRLRQVVAKVVPDRLGLF